MIEKTCIEVLSSSTFNMNLLLNKSRLDLHSPLADLSKLKTLSDLHFYYQQKEDDATYFILYCEDERR